MGLRWWGWRGEVMCGGAAVAVVWWWGGGCGGDDNDAMVMMMVVVASVWFYGAVLEKVRKNDAVLEQNQRSLYSDKKEGYGVSTLCAYTVLSYSNTPRLKPADQRCLIKTKGKYVAFKHTSGYGVSIIADTSYRVTR
ncbi:hypothetical protein Tco_0675398 [Tanacetum coccineum]